MTGGLRLLLGEAATLDAALAGRLPGHAVAEGWNVFPQALPRVRDAVAADPGSVRWGPRLFVLEAPPTVVGWGGFKGPPREGAVEIGYAIAPGCEGRGLATAAARVMAAEALRDPEVRRVLAHTRPEPGASARVLEKVGFRLVGEVPDEGIGTAWRFVLEPPAP